MESEQYTLSGRGPEVVVTLSILAAITTIVSTLRVYVRLRLTKNFGPDDYASLIGWLFYILFLSATIAAAYHGLGQHRDSVHPPTEVENGAKYVLLAETFFTIANGVVKTSICLMLLRYVIEPSHKLIIYIMMGVPQVLSVALFLTVLLQCRPLSLFWRRTQGVSDGQCLNPLVLAIGALIYSIVCVICDMILVVLPWFIVRKMQIDLRTKMMVVFVLALGSVASVGAIARSAFVMETRDTPDLLYALGNVLLWSAYEIGLGLFASCASTLKPLLSQISLLNKRSCEGDDQRRVPHDLAVLPKRKTPDPFSIGLTSSTTRCDFKSDERPDEEQGLNFITSAVAKNADSTITRDDHMTGDRSSQTDSSRHDHESDRF